MDTQLVDNVKVAGLVLLSIIKHCEEETLLADEQVTGVLLGLSVGNTLEITNCFALPKIADDDPSSSEAVSNYEYSMLTSRRELNVDYLSVGYYIGTYGSSFLTRSFLEAVFQYQTQASEAVVLVYNPSCATRGQLGLKSYRLSKIIFDAMLESEKRMQYTGIAKNADMSWECDPSLHGGKTNFTRLLEVLPITVQNSTLARICLKDMVDQSNDESKPTAVTSDGGKSSNFSSDAQGVKALNSFSGLHLSMASNLEQQLRSLLQRLDTIHELQFTYQRTLSKLGQQATSKESKIRELAPIRLETALSACQADLLCSGIAQLAGQTVGKLMMAEAIHQYRNEAPTATVGGCTNNNADGNDESE